MIVLFALLYLWAFWLVFVLVMGLYRAHLEGRLTPLTYVLAAPAVGIGMVMDVAANMILGTIVFLEEPHEWLVTTRLIRLKLHTDWRGKLARFICASMLDVFDPTGKHCE